ncbi:MAG: RidA family protein [candidate division Zixibacteria bacterium]|nr:RidA family protein [candidate division Zixibacteria bacterium]NIR67555.1 RidA family protein [candidate division Zixibacteria bacterium]NIS16525.1 RidA family protein [candidate division Zixibacteria bacterium]NIS48815.1 RidA family protein [candidate division Zixibacteria bacterium]NIT52894.1 RidA family protein [candidate division Zixibacteria bacterium]
MERQNISSGSPYEKSIGFSRAVRIGNIVSVSGTGPLADDGSTYAPGDAYGQAQRCLQIIKKAIEDAGASLDDVIRTRMYIAGMAKWEQVAKAHGEFFSEIRPASTLIEVHAFVRPDWYVEIEADCVIKD